MTKAIMSWCLSAWEALPSCALASWNEAARIGKQTGLDCFLSRNLQALKKKASLANFIVSPGMEKAIEIKALAVFADRRYVDITARLGSEIPGASIRAVHFVILRHQSVAAQFVGSFMAATDDEAPFTVSVCLAGMEAGRYMVWAFSECLDCHGSLKFGSSISASFSKA